MLEEGLKTHTSKEEMYDVVCCGTDLIQSILSSALSRAGKKVLHCDGQEWYGGLDAVLHVGSTMDSFIGECERFARTLAQEELGKKCNMDGKVADSSTLLYLLPQERQGDLRVHSQTFVAASIDSEKMDIIEDSNPILVQEIISDAGNTESCTSSTSSISPKETEQSITMHSLEKGFCFDLTPNLLYASGDAVDGLVKSGVSEYLEFKSLKGLYLLTEEENSTIRIGRHGRGNIKVRNESKEINNDNNDGDDASMNDQRLAIYRVPCSKGDVFRSELLSPVDKRRLMKFLQLIIDYGMATQGGGDQSSTTPGDDVSGDHNREERSKDDRDSGDTFPDLASGEDTIKSVNERHLHRGRALSRPQNKAMPSSSDMDALLRSVHDNTSFSVYLTQVAKLPKRLSNVILFAMALAPFGTSDWQYSTKDGVDDLVRHLTAIGRFGDTAFLVPMYGSGELSQAFCRSGAVYGSTYMLRRSPAAISLDGSAHHVQGIILKGEQHIGGNYNDLDTDDVSDKTILCQHVIVPSTMMMASSSCQKIRTYRRISVLQGKLMLNQVQNDTKQGSDSEQRHAIIIPPETCGLGNTSPIHGVAVDESAFVAPPGMNYTILHLTTSSQVVEDGDIDELSLNALSKAVNYLIASRSTNDDAPCHECHHISFSYSTDESSPTEEDNSSHPSGLHICYRGKQSLTVDSAFREAKRIFGIICPDSEFLALAKKVEDQVVYRDNDEEDDEKDVLESACTMIQAPTQDKVTAIENDVTKSNASGDA